MRIFVYPFTNNVTSFSNTYLEDFVSNLEIEDDVIIVNRNIKGNPLFPLLKFFKNTDLFVFHWLENVPLYRFGYFQFIYSLLCISLLKLFNKKIVFFLHNKKPHLRNSFIQEFCSHFLIRILSKYSDFIFTHAREGLELLNEFKFKSYYFMLPTKNRLKSNFETNFKYDLLIWGSIVRYKGIVEFLQACKSFRGLNSLRISIIGRCNDFELEKEICELCSNKIDFDNRSISFEELSGLLGTVKYVLIPYKSDSVLSSSILMDSLSFGFSVIGPDCSIFSELKYDNRISVHTFSDYKEISEIVNRNNNSLNYNSFLDQYNWINFSKQFLNIVFNK